MKGRSYPHTKETLIACTIASALMLVISFPGFKYFFFAEAFTYLRIYDLHGKHLWEAAFSRMDGMFFRPGFFLADLWWHFVLPPIPILYHIRNFIFCALNLFLFYQVLLRFVQSRFARTLALGLFAGSKMHMTIIGYVNVYEASILLMTILLAVLSWSRYIENRRTLDYSLTVLFCTFSVYSKDNGFVVIGVLAAMVLAFAFDRARVRSVLGYWTIRLIPFGIVAASYLILRYLLTGPINPDNPVYSPRLSLPVAMWQAKAFFATVGNLSLTDPSFMGARGLSSLFADRSRVVEFTLFAGLWTLIAVTVWQARCRWRLLIIPSMWITLYLTPIFLIRNHQVYYHQEPLIGVALLIGICLDKARRSMLIPWLVVTALISINGLISNQRSFYAWQYTADRAEIVKPIVQAERNNPPHSIVFVTSATMRNFWTFAIGGPFVSHLMGDSDTEVFIVDSPSKAEPNSQVYRLPD